MGKCILCGKEAEKIVGYYSADIADVSTSYSTSSNYVATTTTTTTTTTYNNIERQQSYYCYRHNYVSPAIYIIGIIDLLFFIGVCQSIIEGIDYATYGYGALAVAGGLLLILLIVAYFFQAKITGKYYLKFMESYYWKKDAQYEEIIAERLNKSAKKQNTGKRYLTGKEYERLEWK